MRYQFCAQLLSMLATFMNECHAIEPTFGIFYQRFRSLVSRRMELLWLMGVVRQPSDRGCVCNYRVVEDYHWFHSVSLMASSHHRARYYHDLPSWRHRAYHNRSCAPHSFPSAVRFQSIWAYRQHTTIVHLSERGHQKGRCRDALVWWRPRTLPKSVFHVVRIAVLGSRTKYRTRRFVQAIRRCQTSG
ncbi:hypothetical protein P692DRAFT_20533110 [Suillus brevipes Sb2]|nr:hypothetical protein P692DRAFT_20533110 [Suillus brevipes Sb2]